MECGNFVATYYAMHVIFFLVVFRRLGDSTAQSSSYAPPFMPGAQCVLGYAT